MRLFIIQKIINHADRAKLPNDLCLSLLVLFYATYASDVIGINQGQSILLLASR